MKLNFNKRDPVIPDTNLGPAKTRWRTNQSLSITAVQLITRINELDTIVGQVLI